MTGWHCTDTVPGTRCLLWDWVLLYLGVGIYCGTGCLLWDWVFTVGLGVTVSGSGCLLWDWMFTVGLGITVSGSGYLLWDWLLLYLGVGVFHETGCYCTWEWVFSMGLGVTVPGSGCFLCYCTWDWVTLYLGLRIIVPGTRYYCTWDSVLLYLGLGLTAPGTGCYCTWDWVFSAGPVRTRFVSRPAGSFVSSRCWSGSEDDSLTKMSEAFAASYSFQVFHLGGKIAFNGKDSTQCLQKHTINFPWFSWTNTCSVSKPAS